MSSGLETRTCWRRHRKSTLPGAWRSAHPSHGERLYLWSWRLGWPIFLDGTLESEEPEEEVTNPAGVSKFTSTGKSVAILRATIPVDASCFDMFEAIGGKRRLTDKRL